MNCKVGNIVKIKDVEDLKKATNVRSIDYNSNKLAKVYDIYEEMDRYYLDIDNGSYGWSDITVGKFEVDCMHCNGVDEPYFDEDRNLVCDCCDKIICDKHGELI